MKKLLSALLAVLMLFALFPVGGTAFADDDAEHALLSDWADYLLRVEQNDTAMLWALSCAQQALDSNDWDDLLKARLAVSTAMLYVEQTELAEAQMTEQGYKLFAANGQELESVNTERVAYAEEKMDLLHEFEDLQQALDSGFFSKLDLELLALNIELDNRFYELDLEFLAAETDYLLAQLGHTEMTKKFQEAIRASCPRIVSYQSKTEMTADDCETRGKTLYGDMAACKQEKRELVARRESNFDTLQHWIESGDTAALEADLNLPDSMPDTLPYPLWEEESFSAVYFQRDKEGKMAVPRPCDTIETPPVGCVLTYAGVDQAAIYDYMIELIESGVEVLEDKDEDDSFLASCRYKGTEFLVSWEDGEAEISMPNGILCLMIE